MKEADQRHFWVIEKQSEDKKWRIARVGQPLFWTRKDARTWVESGLNMGVFSFVYRIRKYVGT